MGHEDPTALEHGLNASAAVRGRLFDVCPLSLKVTCVQHLMFASDFHNEDAFKSNWEKV